jgi:DUF917 family protein
MLVESKPVVTVTNLVTKEFVTLIPTENTEASVIRLAKSARKDIAIVKGLRSGRIWPRFTIFANTADNEIEITVQYLIEEKA